MLRPLAPSDVSQLLAIAAVNLALSLSGHASAAPPQAGPATTFATKAANISSSAGPASKAPERPSARTFMRAAQREASRRAPS